MSFILDALKKSENDRQQQVQHEFATVPSSPDSPAAPRWLWVFGLLLLINAVVLLFVFTRPEAPLATASSTPSAIVAVEQPAAVAAEIPTQQGSFADRVDEAVRNQPDVSARETTVSMGIDNTPAVADDPGVSSAPANFATPVEPVSTPQQNELLLPTLTELQLNGTLQLPELHMDLHVYKASSTERFVFINMNKYRENSQLDEGPVLREITANGVVLEYRGRAFLLPRE